ncbi:MAG: hypothetical protein LC676_02270 [Loktanella sp.]|nr:hypothetical protein [Loktanella sp.]
MFKKTSIIAVLAITGLSACQNIDTDSERALVGAGLAGGAAALGGADNRDTATAAAIGAAGGALADDVGLMSRSR